MSKFYDDEKVLKLFNKLIESIGLSPEDIILTDISNGYYSNIINFNDDDYYYSLEFDSEIDDSIVIESEKDYESHRKRMLILTKLSDDTAEIDKKIISEIQSLELFVELFKLYYRSLTMFQQVINVLDSAIPLTKSFDRDSTFNISFNVDDLQIQKEIENLQIDESVIYYTGYDKKQQIWVDVEGVGDWDLSEVEVMDSFNEEVDRLSFNLTKTAQVICHSENRTFIIFVYLLDDKTIDELSVNTIELSQDVLSARLYSFKKK